LPKSSRAPDNRDFAEFDLLLNGICIFEMACRIAA
jgi:hypothetical protein